MSVHRLGYSFPVSLLGVVNQGSFFSLLSLFLVGCVHHPSGELGSQDSPVLLQEPLFDDFTQASAKERGSGAHLLEHQEVLETFGGVYHLPRLEAGIERIMQRLVHFSTRPSLQYKVTILNSSSIHAFLLPGERVYLTRGLLALINNEDELAAVLAHEIGHVTAGHQPAFSMKYPLDSAIPVQGSSQEDGEPLVVSFSKQQELEADEIGVQMVFRSGFNPLSAVSFLKSLMRREKWQKKHSLPPRAEDSGLSITHPTLPERISRIQRKADLFQASSIRYVSSRERYLELIDGMVYGHSPRDGYIRGKTFIHPQWRILFAVPENFTLHNARDAVFAVGTKDNVVRFDGVELHTSGESLVDSIHLMKKWSHDVVVDPVKAQTQGGLPVVYGEARHGEWHYLLAMVQADSRIAFRFLLAQQQISEESREEFQNIVASLRRLGRQEALSVRPLRVRVIRAEPEDTVAFLSRCCMHWMDDPETRFRILNGLKPWEDLEAGQLVKVIVEE